MWRLVRASIFRGSVSFTSLLLLVALPFTRACADTAPTVQFLMNEPVTMFDLGMIRIEEKLAALKSDHLVKDNGKIDIQQAGDVAHMRSVQFPDDMKIVSAFPDYDFQRGTLNWSLMGVLPYEESRTVETMQSECTTSLAVFREHIMQYVFFIPFEVPWAANREAEYMAGWFGHNGFDRSDRPRDIGEALLKASRIQVIVMGSTAPAYEWYRCSRQFAGDAVTLLPPFDAAGQVKQHLARCLVKPKSRLSSSINLNVTLTEDGKVENEVTFSDADWQDSADPSLATWTAAIASAARDPMCQPLNLPKDRWPDWKNVYVNYGPAEAK